MAIPTIWIYVQRILSLALRPAFSDQSFAVCLKIVTCKDQCFQYQASILLWATISPLAKHCLNNVSLARPVLSICICSLGPRPWGGALLYSTVSELLTIISSCKSQIIAFVTHVHICFTLVWKLLVIWMSSGVLDTPLQLLSCPSFHCPQGFCIEVNDDTEMKLVTQLHWLPTHACIKKIW